MENKTDEAKIVGNVMERIHMVYGKINSIRKTATIKITKDRKYDAVEHDQVTKELRVFIRECGLVVIPSMENFDVTTREYVDNYGNNKIERKAIVLILMRIQNINDKEDFIESKSYAYALDSGDKATAKAYSMAVKNAYLKLFMLESGDKEESRDNENNNHSKPSGHSCDIRQIVLSRLEASREVPEEHKPSKGQIGLANSLRVNFDETELEAFDRSLLSKRDLRFLIGKYKKE